LHCQTSFLSLVLEVTLPPVNFLFPWHNNFVNIHVFVLYVILIFFCPAPHLQFCYAILIGLFDIIWYGNVAPKLLHFKYYYPVIYRLHSQIRSHSLTQSHMKDNNMINLTGFLFSMIIHFHHCYIKISYTVKQAYKDGIAKFEMWCRTEEDQNHI
jgi:hypothetical protein